MGSKILSLLLTIVFTVYALNAQRIIGCGDPPPPPPPPSPSPTPTPTPATCPFSINVPETNTSWGFFNWQVDGLTVDRIVLSSEMDFFPGPPDDFPANPGFTQVTITIPSQCAARVVHEVHGNVALEVQAIGPDCGHASIIAQILDQNGNNLASATLNELGLGQLNIPIKGTFSTPLSVTAFQLQFFLNAFHCDTGGSQVVSWSLSMS